MASLIASSAPIRPAGGYCSTPARLPIRSTAGSITASSCGSSPTATASARKSGAPELAPGRLADRLAQEGEDRDQHGGADDRRVGQVEGPREVRQVDPVHHPAPERAGGAEQPVAEVAGRPAEQQPERDRPGNTA